MIRFPTTSHEWHMQNMEDMRRDQHSRKYPNDLATGHAGPLRLTRPSAATPEPIPPAGATTNNATPEKRKS